MKRRLLPTLALLGTASAVTLSFLLPHALSKVQDQILKSKTIEIENNIITMGPTFFERLQFFSTPYVLVTLNQTGSDPNEQMQESVLDALSFFADSGLDWLETNSYTTMNLSQALAVSTSSAQTALVWQYVLSDKLGNFATGELDDTSQKLIYFQFFAPENGALQKLSEDASAFALKLADACVSYYGFQSVEVQTPASSYKLPDLYRYTFTTRDGQTLEARFILNRTYMQFKWGPFD